MSYPISINFQFIDEICKNLNSPETFEIDKVAQEQLMFSLKRTLGMKRIDEGFEFDEWLMIGNYKFFVSLQPSYDLNN